MIGLDNNKYHASFYNNKNILFLTFQKEVWILVMYHSNHAI